jgi:hypothetical protein
MHQTGVKVRQIGARSCRRPRVDGCAFHDHLAFGHSEDRRNIRMMAIVPL